MTADRNASDDAELEGLEDLGEFDELDAEALSAIEAAFGADALDMLDDADDADALADLPSPDAAGADETGADEAELPIERLLERIDAGEAGWSDLRMARRESTTAARRYVGVEVGGDGYLVPLESVAEVQRVPRVSYVPFVPAWVAGVCNFRGQVVSVVDLRAFFGGQTNDAAPAGRVVFVRTQPPDLCVALLVDRVGGVQDVGPDDVELIPPMMRNRVASYLTGTCRLGEQTWCVLDAERMLRAEEFRQVDRGG